MAGFSEGSMDESANLAEDVQRLFEDLARRRPDQRQMVVGECMPVVDVFETDRAVEIVADLPGISADSVRLLFKAGVLLMVGEKERPDLTKRGPASFHVVERDFGRFVRAVRIGAAVDGSLARARLNNGELRIVFPRIQERRGTGIAVPIESTAPEAQ